MTMAKRDLSRSFWCILAFVIGLIFATSSGAHDAMTICRRIQSNDLKIRTMGLVGDKFIVLTSEGHLFYLPKVNLRGVDTSSTTLTIDQVPVSANRVFGVNLDYSIRHGYFFILLVDGQSNSELLMTLQVESEEVSFQAFYLDWKKNLKRQKLHWTKEKVYPKMKFNFNPDFIVNQENSNCAESRRNFKKIIYELSFPEFWVSESFENFSATTQFICLNDDSLDINWTEKNSNSWQLDDSPKGPTILTAFLAGQREDGSSNKFKLFDDGKFYHLTGRTETATYHSQLNYFIRCGPNFTDNSHNLEPSKDKVVEATNYKTSENQSSTDEQNHLPRWLRIWIIATGVSLVIAVTFVCSVIIKKLIKKKKKKKKCGKRGHKRSRKDKHSSMGSNASSGCSSAFSNSNVSNGTSSPIQGSSGKETKSKHRSFMDTVSSVFNKNQKKNAKQRSKVKKAKENQKKKNGCKK